MSNLTVTDLVVRYGGVTAVDGVSFTVAEGEFVSLLGPSGCGKTTSLRCIAGLESLSSGEIRIGGDVVARAGFEVPPERRGVNMVFQSYAVWPHMSVFENVAYGLRTRGMPRAEIKMRVDEVLRLVGLEAFGSRYGTELSGGQQQRVAVARAVVTEPRLLLFDEPLSNLDAGLRERMRFELLALQRRLGRTSVYVTHDQAEAMAVSDRIAVMRSGEIAQFDRPETLYNAPATPFVASFIGGFSLLQGQGEDRVFRVGEQTMHLPAPAGPGVLVIRPEDARPASEHPLTSLTGRVIGAAYQGRCWRLSVAIGGCTLRLDWPGPVQTGADLTFSLPPDRCRILTLDPALNPKDA
jgi:iron(III) transport system ATP-binding protein